MIHFSRTQKPHIAEINRPDIGLVVKPKAQIKWLEFIWNYRLFFKPHFETRQNLALTAFENIRRLATTQTGLRFSTMKQLYMACITTVADYRIELL